MNITPPIGTSRNIFDDISHLNIIICDLVAKKLTSFLYEQRNESFVKTKCRLNRLPFDRVFHRIYRTMSTLIAAKYYDKDIEEYEEKEEALEEPKKEPKYTGLSDEWEDVWADDLPPVSDINFSDHFGRYQNRRNVDERPNVYNAIKGVFTRNLFRLGVNTRANPPSTQK